MKYFFMNEIKDITIYGKPQAQGRPRARRLGNFISIYDPHKKEKEAIRKDFKEQQLEGALHLDFVAYMPIPKSTSKKMYQELLGSPHTKKPDIDNLVKFYLDTFNGILYYDDSQIATLVAKKVYGEEPKVVINIKKIWVSRKTNRNDYN